MAKPASSSLYDLIHSLSSSEQRYLTLSLQSQKKDSILKLMFEVIQGQDKFNDVELFAKLKRSLTSKTSYRVYKHSLYSMILKAMRQFHAFDADIDTQLHNHIQDIGFLLSKKLYDEAERLLLRAKRIAIRFERYNYQLDLISQENRLLTLRQNLKDIADLTEKIHKEAKETVKLVMLQFDLEAVDLHIQEIIINSNFISEGFDERISKIKALQDNPVFRDGAKITEVRILKFFLEEYALEQEEEKKGKTDWKRMFQRQKKFLNQLINEGKGEVIESYDSRFVAFLWNYIRKASNVDIPTLHEALEVFKKARFTDEGAIRTQQTACFYMSMRLAYVTGNSKKFFATLKQYNSFLKKNERRISNHLLMLLYSSIGENYLMHGNFVESEKYFRKVIFVNKRNLGTREDLKEAALLALLVINCEKGAFQEIPRIKRSIENYLPSHPSRTIDQVLLTFANLFIKAQTSQERKLIYQGTYSNLDELMNKLPDTKLKNPNKVVLDIFDFLGWFKHKATGKPFTQIIREANDNV